MWASIPTALLAAFPTLRRTKEKTRMESLLTSTAEILVIGFALLMALDFFSGLVHLYRSVPLQTQPHDEPETESVMPEEYALMGASHLCKNTGDSNVVCGVQRTD